MQRRVLVLLDGSARAEQALPEALAHARACRAELYLLRVVHPPASLLWRRVNRDAERAAWLYLLTVAERISADCAGVSYRVRLGWAYPVLRRETEGASGLFLATRGAAVLRRLLGSSLFTVLVAHRSCTVVVVRAPKASLGKKEQVRSFAADAQPLGQLVQRPLGVRPVSLDRIVGSVGRAHELLGDFRPLSAGEADLRYRELRRAMEQGVEVPPVELFKLGDRYYVLDGNHRVSIALALGWSQVDAVITEFVPVGNADAQLAARERWAFERTTGLQTVGAVRPGHYPRLESLIQDHAAREGIVDCQDAAGHWYAHVYLPLERRIQTASLGALFSGESTGDVVAHLAEAREADEEFLGRPVSLGEELDLMLERYRNWRRPAGARFPDFQHLLHPGR